MKHIVLIGLLTVVGSFASAMPYTPDLSMTPGQLCSPRDPDFKGYRHREKVPVCDRDVSTGLKARIYDAYGIPVQCRKSYIIDHFVPLSIGGNNAPQNLWPEHHAIRATRAMLEQNVFDAVSRGQMKARDGIRLIMKEKMNPKIPRNYRLHPCN